MLEPTSNSESQNAYQLNASEVHVWQTSLENSPEKQKELHALLSPDEQARAARFHAAHHTRRYIAANGALRILLSKYLNVAPEKINFFKSPYGKPFITPELENSSLQFNMTHSKEIVLYAITQNQSIGIDIEFMRERVMGDAIAKRYFTSSEYEALNQCNEADKLETFNKLWVSKEAFAKTIGLGLSYPLQDIEFEVGGISEDLKLKHIEDKELAAETWSVFGLKPANDYAGTLVVRGHVLNCGYSLFKT